MQPRPPLPRQSQLLLQRAPPNCCGAANPPNSEPLCSKKSPPSCDVTKQAFALSKFLRLEKIGRKPTPMSPKPSISAIFTLRPCDNSGHLTVPRRSPVNPTFSIGGRVASG